VIPYQRAALPIVIAGKDAARQGGLPSFDGTINLTAYLKNPESCTL
jgi:hypothetical protein